jgi:coproporphyrinogen III oxidase
MPRNDKTQWVWGLALFASAILAAPAVATPNDGVEGLNEEQQAFAARHLEFLDRVDDKLFSMARNLNSGKQSDESETMEFGFADYNVRVARGDVVEKIGRMTSRVYEPTSDRQRPTVFGRYYGVDVHAKSPLMGQVHAAIVLQYYPDGVSALGGTLNLLKGGAQQEDLDYVKQAIDAVFEKHERDPAPYRERVCNMADEAVRSEFHRKLSCVGASFFGFPMMEVTEENFLFMAEVYERFITAYLETLNGRKDEPYTEENISIQDTMRLNWLEDQAFGDPYSSGGITPYEVWGRAFLPPIVKF